MTLTYIASAVGAVISSFVAFWPLSLLFAVVCLLIFLASTTHLRTTTR